MIRTLQVLVLTFSLLSCTQKQDERERVYYIIKQGGEKEHQGPIDPTEPPPLPIPFYGAFNFILADGSTVYFHNKYHRYEPCGVNGDPVRPPRLFLFPEQLREVKIRDLRKFLTIIYKDTNDLDYRKNPRWGLGIGRFLSVISSPSDTIKHEGFKIIDDFIRQNNFKYTVIRKWTEEEQYVTTAKIKHKKYDANTIKWKVGFEQ